MKQTNEYIQSMLDEHDEKESLALTDFLEKYPVDGLSDEEQKIIITAFKYGFLYGVTSK